MIEKRIDMEALQLYFIIIEVPPQQIFYYLDCVNA